MTRLTEVDGIPTVLAPTDGPMHAGLAFRVGMADEGLPQRGVTHLVEHLVLQAMGVTDHHYNGATAVRYTYVHVDGSPSEVVQFLNGVCASIRALPTARLAAEKEILRTEAQGRGSSARSTLDLWRYGSRGYGTYAYPELGVDALTADDLQAWVARYFTTQNAALWIAADEVPAGLRLELPLGERRPLPPVTSALPVRPAYFTGDEGVVAWDTVVPHAPATSTFAEVLGRALRRSLRHESGLSYQASTDREVLWDGTDLVLAYADALPEKQGAVLGGMVDVLAALRVGRVEQADLDAVRDDRLEAYAQARRTAAHLPGDAIGLLFDEPVLVAEQVESDIRGVTAADVAGVARAAWADGLAMVPPGPGAEWAGFAPAPVASSGAVQGVEHAQLGRPGTRLVLAADGISLLPAEGSPGTVLFADCVAVLAWPDGARRLLGADGIGVWVEPTLYAPDAGLTAFVDAHTAPGLRVDRPAREPDDVPRPPATEPAGGAGTPGRLSTGRGVLLLLLLLPALLAGLVVFAGGIIFLATDDDSGIAGPVVVMLVGLFVLGSAGWFTRRVILRMTG